MRKHGLKSASKRERLLAEAEDEAVEAMAEQARHLSCASHGLEPALHTICFGCLPCVAGKESIAGCQGSSHMFPCMRALV